MTGNIKKGQKKLEDDKCEGGALKVLVTSRVNEEAKTKAIHAPGPAGSSAGGELCDRPVVHLPRRRTGKRMKNRTTEKIKDDDTE